MSVGLPKDPRPGLGTSLNPLPVLSTCPYEGLSPHPTACPAGSSRLLTGPSQIPFRRPLQNPDQLFLRAHPGPFCGDAGGQGGRSKAHKIKPESVAHPVPRPGTGPYFLRSPRTRLQPPQAPGLHLSDPFSQGLRFLQTPRAGLCPLPLPRMRQWPLAPPQQGCVTSVLPGQDLRPGRSSSSSALDVSSVLGVDIACLRP